MNRIIFIENGRIFPEKGLFDLEGSCFISIGFECIIASISSNLKYYNSTNRLFSGISRQNYRHLASPGILFVDPSMTLVDPSMTLVDPSMALVDPSVALVDPSVALVDPSVTLVDPSVALVDPGTTLVDPGMVFAESWMKIVHPELQKYDPERFSSLCNLFSKNHKITSISFHS